MSFMDSFRDNLDDSSRAGEELHRRNHGEDDPYYLQGSDNPGLILVTNVLNERNYLQWNTYMKKALSAKMKLGFINGTIPEPNLEDRNYNAWKRVDDMISSWIINSISKDIADGFVFTSSARDLWIQFQEQFGESNRPMIYKIQREIASFAQGNLSVTMYYTGLKKLWDELACLVPTSNCGCAAHKSTIEANAVNKLMQFLMGLSDSFDNIRSQILVLEPIPPVKAYSMILRVEKIARSK